MRAQLLSSLLSGSLVFICSALPVWAGQPTLRGDGARNVIDQVPPGLRPGGQASTGRIGGRIYIPQPTYYYIVPKAATRAQIIRNRQLLNSGAAPVQQTTPTSIDPGVSERTASVQQQAIPSPPDEGGIAFVPHFSPAPAPRAAAPMRALKPIGPPASPETLEQERTEKAPPISVASGPLYNDRDSLLGFQQQQAEKGNAESQYVLGLRYLTGNGVEQNDVLAREWLEKASRGGNLKARAKLKQEFR